MHSKPEFSRQRRLALSVPAAAAAVAALPARAQDAAAPRLPVRIVVGFAPGTSPDLIARVIARKVEERWTAGVVVDNRPGAGGMIAVNGVGTAPADGQTFLLGEFGSIAISPNVYRKLQVDPGTLVPVANLAAGDMTFVVGSQRGIGSMAEWRRATQDASPLLIGTFGPATPHHLSAAMLGETLGRKVEPVHYRAPQEALAGATSGELHGVFVSSTLALAWMKTGKINVLAVTSPVRSAMLPDVPSYRELGLERAEYEGWIGIFAPPRTPEAVLDRAHAAFTEAARSADVERKMAELGYRTTPSARKEFEERTRRDRLSIKRVTDALNLTLD